MKIPGRLFTIILAAVIVTASCAGSKYSYKQKNEQVGVKLHEERDALALNTLNQQDIPLLAERGQKTRGVFAPFVGAAISLAAKGIGSLIKAEQAKYTATYEDSLVENYFYDQLSDKSAFDPTGAQFKSFTLLRMADVKKGRQDTALYVVFEVDTSNPYEIINSSMFRLKMTQFQVNYAKAKVSTTKWWAPDSWGNKKNDAKLNMDIYVSFHATYATKDGLLHKNTEIGQFVLPLRNIPLDTSDKNYFAYRNNLKGKLLEGSSFLIPRSFGYAIGKDGNLAEAYSQGKYSMHIKVVETGKQKFIAKMAAENSGKLLDTGADKLKDVSTKYLNKY